MTTLKWLKNNWRYTIQMILIIIMLIIVYNDRMSYKAEIERCWRECKPYMKNYTPFTTINNTTFIIIQGNNSSGK